MDQTKQKMSANKKTPRNNATRGSRLQKKPSYDVVNAYDEIKRPECIDLSGDFQQQMDNIVKAVIMTQKEISSLSRLYSDLEIALRTQWPECTVEPFGSATTGLGFKNSDADCLINIRPNPNTNSLTQSEMSSPDLVRKAACALQEFPKLFLQIRPVPRPNMPIVKLFHKPTKKYCDVTFKSQLGARNSKLITFLLNSDPRLLPMAVAIKYWAKVYNISGTTKLKNYTLTMLVIFYLQQPSISILPSIRWLQSDPTNDVFVDDWNTGFLTDSNLLPQPSNALSTSDLLGGFFEYYSNFDFEKMTISPYLGRPIEKKLFSDLNQLPDEFELCKKGVGESKRSMKFNTAISVQDPFDHRHNIGSSINLKLASDIKYLFKSTANAYNNAKLQECKFFLKTILLNRAQMRRAELLSEYHVILSVMKTDNDDWKAILRQIICTIFEKMLKIKLENIGDSNLMDEQETFAATITKAIWNRKHFAKMNTTKMEFQKEQEKITDMILNEETPINLQLQLKLVYARIPVVSISVLGGDEYAFNDFGDFFLIIMKHWFNKLLKSDNEPLENNAAVKITRGMVKR